MAEITPKERFIAALERRPLEGRVSHFELVFFLTMEAFGKVHPLHRDYSQWIQMTEHERHLHCQDMAQVYIDIAERFQHDAILLHQWPGSDGLNDFLRLVDEVKSRVGDRYFLMMQADATLPIPSGGDMEKISVRMAEEPEKVDADLAARVDCKLDMAERLSADGGIDGLALCADYCFNSGPFLSLAWFDRFITPNLIRLAKGYRDTGFYTIKHTDGNIIPILDRLIEAGPDALHSLDPQGGVDMAEIVRLVGDKVTLCGNVHCGKLQTGTDKECVESARYALKHGMAAPGYIFCTSNCIFTGMELDRYELILDVWRKEGIRSAERKETDSK